MQLVACLHALHEHRHVLQDSMVWDMREGAAHPSGFDMLRLNFNFNFSSASDKLTLVEVVVGGGWWVLWYLSSGTFKLELVPVP